MLIGHRFKQAQAALTAEACLFRSSCVQTRLLVCVMGSVALTAEMCLLARIE